ncbi:MAG: Lrp/AsnC family transcriptional regulator [Gammaproteobacteria bacterium]|nr:Lrp/AsnC family transcriptional regulator [Gammaproteobacteria bacterium]
MTESVDDVDRILLKQLQVDASLSMDRLAQLAGISKTAAWNRIQRMQQKGIIRKQVAVLDAALLGLHETFFIAIKTSKHNEQWLVKFNAVIKRHPEIVEAHRLSGDTDYLLKVQVASTRDFDELYKRIVAAIDLFSVTSSLSMEVLKRETSLPL